MLSGFDPNQITTLDGARQAVTWLLNLVEELAQENGQLRVQVQHLRDEINRLKGDKGSQISNPISPRPQPVSILLNRSGGSQSPIAKAVKFTKPHFLLNKNTTEWLTQFDTPQWAQQIIST